MSGLFAGIDIGTASTKGVLVDPAGTVLTTSTRPHELSLPRPGWAEHDAERVWWADVVEVCRELLARATAPIAGVGISGVGPCVLPADAAGNPLRPAILYGIDTRATAQIEAQRRRYGAAAVLDRCGSPLTTQAVGPKLEWLRANEPELWTKTRRLFMPSSFVAYRLTGEYFLDHHSASQCVPMYHLADGGWAEDWAAEIAPGLALPPLRWPGEVVGTVTAAAAAATGLPAGVPVVAGTIDAWAEALSVGVRDPGDLMVMYGSTMFLVLVVDQPLRSPSLWATAGLAAGTYSLAAGMATSGSLASWVRRLTGNPDFDTLTAEATAISPGSEGLVVLPYFAGERTPLFDPDARGLVLGLTLRHGRGHLYRAVLEGTAFGVRHNLETMIEAGARPRRLVAVGGGTTGRLWAQIVSDVLRQPQQIARVTVGASYGDAMLAAAAVLPGLPVHQWNPPVEQVRPDEANLVRYDRLYETYRSLYPATREAAHTLAAMQSASPGSGQP